LRDVKSGMQEIISYDKIVEEVKKRLGKWKIKKSKCKI
jgi:hypothetical protein